MNEKLTVYIPETKDTYYNIHIDNDNISTLKSKLSEEIKGRNLLIVFFQNFFSSLSVQKRKSTSQS